MTRWIIAGALLLASWAAHSQNFASGVTDMRYGAGTLRINSGHVGNFNAHDFHVYSFQFIAGDQDQRWNQVPLVVAGAPALEFIVTTTSTADFSTRDAMIRQEGPDLVLSVARLRFDGTPYDSDAWVEVSRYRLRHLDDEDRWIFEQIGVGRAPPGTTVDGFVASDPKS